MKTLELVNLPLEILEMIFSHVPLLGLHLVVKPICRLFHSIIDGSYGGPLSVTLFREPLRPKLLPTDEDPYMTLPFHGKPVRRQDTPSLILHPALRKLAVMDHRTSYLSSPMVVSDNYTLSNSVTSKPSIVDVGFVSFAQKRAEFIPLASIPIAYDNACLPARSEITISCLGCKDGIILYAGNGRNTVTVWDVAEGLAKCMHGQWGDLNECITDCYDPQCLLHPVSYIDLGGVTLCEEPAVCLFPYSIVESRSRVDIPI